MDSIPAILLLHPFDALISPALKAVYLSMASFGDAREEACFIFLSYRAISTERGRAYVFGALMDGESRSLLFSSAVANYRSGGRRRGRVYALQGGALWILGWLI